MHTKKYNSSQKAGSVGTAAFAVALTSMAVSMSADARGGSNNSTGTISLSVNDACEIVIDSTKEISNIILDLGTDSEFKLEDLESNQFIIGDYADGIPYGTINVKAGNNGVRGVGESLDLTIPAATQCEDEPEVTTYMIGDFGPGGGIVFQVSADGTTGLEFSPQYIASTGPGTIEWGCQDVDVAGLPNLAGFDNTGQPLQTIQSGEDNIAPLLAATCNPIAAQEAFDYDFIPTPGVLVDDWYLPSIEELQEIQMLFPTVSLEDESNGSFASLNTLSFWSSTEQTAVRAWSLTPSGSAGVPRKDTGGLTISVLPIRSF